MIDFVAITAGTQQTFYKEPQWFCIELSRVPNRRLAELVFTEAVCFKHMPETKHVVEFTGRDPGGILSFSSWSLGVQP